MSQDIAEGSTLEFDLSVNIGALGIPWSFECAACGEVCEIEVPIIGFEVSFDMPDCPIQAGEYDFSSTFTLPANSPTSGTEIGVEGDVSLRAANDQEVAFVTVDVEVE